MAVNPVINISIPQGADFSETFVSTESDGSTSNLDGYTGTAKMKKYYDSPTSTTFSVSITSAIGEVTISLPASTTSGLEPGRYNYDVRLESGTGAISRLVEGMAFVTAGITTG
jgi:hypothetical protein